MEFSRHAGYQPAPLGIQTFKRKLLFSLETLIVSSELNWKKEQKNNHKRAHCLFTHAQANAFLCSEVYEITKQQPKKIRFQPYTKCQWKNRSRLFSLTACGLWTQMHSAHTHTVRCAHIKISAVIVSAQKVNKILNWNRWQFVFLYNNLVKGLSLVPQKQSKNQMFEASSTI